MGISGTTTIHNPAVPVQLNLQGRLAVLVGGGPVALGKARKLREGGAVLRVIAPTLEVPAAWENLGATHHPRDYAGPEDLVDAFMVIAATPHPEVNARVVRDAQQIKALTLRTDQAEGSDLAFPATLRQGHLTVSFATDGLSPAYAARLKREAALHYGPERGAELERAAAGRLPEDPFPAGSVALVGAGPGDPGLLTLKAAQRLAQADVVVHDALANADLLTRYAPAARHIDAGKHKGHCVLTQDQTNALLVELAGQGLRVLRLKGGDPCLFGRAGEEARALVQAGIPFEIVPGVSSLSAVPAAAGMAVTDRDFGRSVGAFSLHKREGLPPSEEEWERMARGPETLVLFMGRSVVREACRELIARGRAPELPAALVVNGTLPSQAVVQGTLADLADRVDAQAPQGPGLIVVGECVRLREILAAPLEVPCPV
jgi:uroporphyrin-III C-methyltransferase/precorrin-2 dehydrogenase/sirohydrochlorin ferrochelatase